MLQAYCDCSRRHGIVAIASLVKTSRLFVGYDSKIMVGVNDTAHGELHAMLMAMCIVNNSFNKPQELVLNSDCAALVQNFQRTIAVGKEPFRCAYYQDWISLFNACRGHKVIARYVKGHVDKRTFHSICDISTRAILREVGTCRTQW